MFRSSWKRALTAVLIVTVCALAVPATASATARNMDSDYYSATKLWNTAMNWFWGLWTTPAASSAPRGNLKFGAGHSSDGRSLARPAIRAPF